jgi:hypothetical protein
MSKKLFAEILTMVVSLVFITTSCSVIRSISGNNIATVESIQYQLAFSGDGVVVNLKPSSGAVANRSYTVDLYESGRYRATQSISWDSSELQIYTIKPLTYILPDTELEALPGNINDASSVFSVKIH